MLRTTSRPDHQKGRTPNEVGGSRFCFAPEMVLRANDGVQMVDLIFNGAEVLHDVVRNFRHLCTKMRVQHRQKILMFALIQ